MYEFDWASILARNNLDMKLLNTKIAALHLVQILFIFASHTLASLPGIPEGVTSQSLDVLDLRMHLLTAKPPSNSSVSNSTIPTTTTNKPPLILLIHGFPEIAYSWRKVMLPLSQAGNGYLVVAPDLRGYGQTIQLNRAGPTSKITYDEDLSPYRMLNMVSDVIELVYALGYDQVDMLVGHDIGSGIASYCALLRPDIFKSLAMLSVPFAGPPSFSSLNSTSNSSETTLQELDEALGKLEGPKKPKKHYMVYFSSPEADGDLSHPPQGVHNFTQAYYFIKSAGWVGNSHPHSVNSSGLASIASNTTIEAQALAQIMPPYYIIPSNQTMPETVSSFSPTPEEIKQQETWLPDDELEVYISTYNHTGFQGGLNYYRGQSSSSVWMEDINKLAAGKKVEVPAMFLAGKKDWGAYLFPGVLERMRNDTTSSMGEAKNVFEKMREEDMVFIEGAGHWLQQEKPDEVVKHLKRFISEIRS